MYNIIQKRNIWIGSSAFLVIASIVMLFMWGLNFGIDFTGGALMEVEFNNDRPMVGDIQDSLSDLNLGSLVVQPVGEKSLILRFQDISEEKHHETLKRLAKISESDNEVKEEDASETNNATSTVNIDESDTIEVEVGEGATTSVSIDMEKASSSLLNSDFSNIQELRYDSVGPSIGQELKSKAMSATVLVLIMIIIYIAWTFRKVSKPIASWKFGIAAIIALFHDVIIVLGVFAYLGHFYDIEINTAFVAAILTVLGYSVNDTIVVFDRIRENLPKSDVDFEETVNISVNQTIVRSINTSLTTLLVLLSIVFFGGATIRDFVLALSIGVFIGTYSSIFLASPVLVIWEKLRK